MNVGYPDDEIDLRAYVEVIRRRKWAIIGTTIISVLIATTFSFWVLPLQYEASAWLVVAQPPLQIGGNQTTSEQGPRVTAVFVPSTAPENVVTLSTTPGVLQQMLENLPERFRQGLTVGGLRGMVKAKVERNTSLVVLTVRGGEPEKVAAIANTWANAVATVSHALFESSARETYKFFQEQTAKAQEQLGAAEAELRDFDSRNLIGLLQAEINTVTGQIADYNAQLQKLRVEEMKLASRLEEIRRQLRDQPKVLSRTTALANQPFLYQTTKDLTQKDYQNLAQLRLIDEQLNPVYLNLEQARADATVTLATLRAEQEQVRATVQYLTARLKALQDNLAQEQYRRTQLARAVETARELYGVLVRRMEEMRVASLVSAGSVRVISPAAKPQSPVAPNKRLNIILAGVLGIMAGTFLAFLQEFLAPKEPSRVSEQPLPAGPKA